MDNNYEGLFEMATGSGKTFTSISAAAKLLELKGEICLVVLAPYQHLVTQWSEELKMFGFSPVLCFKSSKEWQNTAYTELQKHKAGIKNKVCFVATHATSSLKPFQEFVKSITCDWMLIADEVHGLGSENQSIALFSTAKYKIGLSATPQRWFDEEGTKRLTDYFKKTVIEYGLEDAINAGALTRYEYEPVLIELNEIELDRFEHLSHKIGILTAKKSKTKKEQDEFEFLCRQRAAVIGKAERKIPKLLELVNQHKEEIVNKGEKYIHNLYYCAPGEHKDVLKALSEQGIRVHEFVSDVPQKERDKVLKAFANGDIDGIVAIKCLDEGVDIPATKRAYILASSTNPREFVQRRGRVLRKNPGKNRAYIYDFFVGPWSLSPYSRSTAQSLLRRELPRFSEFNSLNEKKYEAIKEIRYACEYFNMVNEIDMKPWEVYGRIIANHSDLLIASEDRK
jgi:superfamily II DNA or RNA helicase